MTSRASLRACHTWPTSESTQSGSRRSTRHRWPTAATTSPTTATSTPVSEHSTTSTHSLPRPPASTSRSSSTSCPTTPRASTRGSSKLCDPASPGRDRYIFRDGNGTGPPNDWITLRRLRLDPRRPDGAVVLPPFDHEQPDLNWDPKSDSSRTRSASGLTAASKGSGSTRRRHGQGPSRLPYRRPTLDRAWDGQPALGRRRGARDLRALASGLRRYDRPHGVAEAWYPPRSGRASTCGQTNCTRPSTSPASSRLGRRRVRADHRRDHIEHSERSGALTTWVLSSHDESGT